MYGLSDRKATWRKLRGWVRRASVRAHKDSVVNLRVCAGLFASAAIMGYNLPIRQVALVCREGCVAR